MISFLRTFINLLSERIFSARRSKDGQNRPDESVKVFSKTIRISIEDGRPDQFPFWADSVRMPEQPEPEE